MNLASAGNRVILLDNVVISKSRGFLNTIYLLYQRRCCEYSIRQSISHSESDPHDYDSGYGRRDYTQTVLQSQSSNATITPLSLFPEHLAWQFQVTGLVRTDLNLTVADSHQIPLTSVEAAIYCLPSSERCQGYFHGGNWTGIKLRDILDQVGVLPETQKLAFYASYGFTTDLTLDVVLGEDVILAFGKDGRPLRQHMSLVVPSREGYKWIHSLLRIEAVDYDFKGLYEQNGFPDDAIISAQPYS